MESEWFGDTRLVRTAVADGPDSEEPVYLPTDPTGCDRIKRRYVERSFHCGRLLGGCGEPLKARTYHDRVCHFAHYGNGARRCRRPSVGEDGADHLYIGKALSQWLDDHRVPHGPAEYVLDPRGRAEAVVLQTKSRGIVHTQLSGSSLAQWKRQRAAIMREHPGSIVLCAPKGSLRQHEVGQSGRALVVFCVTSGDSRDVMIQSFRDGRYTQARPLSAFRLDASHGMVVKESGPSPLLLRGRAGKPARDDRACSRFHADGERCDRLTDAADGWCRGPDCGGFRTAEPPPLAKARSSALPAERDRRARLVRSNFERGNLRVSGTAVIAFRAKHQGSPQDAAAELHAMAPTCLDHGEHCRLPDGTWVLEHLGYRLLLNEKGDEIIGYDSMHVERSHAQLASGVPSRLGRQGRAQRRSLRTPVANGQFPDRLDPDSVCRLNSAQFAVTADACLAFEMLSPTTATDSDRAFIDALYGALDEDLRTGKVVADADRLILYGARVWWVLAVNEPAVIGVYETGTRALLDRDESDTEAHDEAPEAPARDEQERPTLAEFETIVGDRISNEREDDLHEEIRHRLMADLKLRSRTVGGRAGDGVYVDAWYETDKETTVFEVLETGGVEYADFRRAAVNLMEVAYLHTDGKGASMVLVAAEPPVEPWIPNTLLNVFGIYAVWMDGFEWAGPGRGFIRGT